MICRQTLFFAATFFAILEMASTYPMIPGLGGPSLPGIGSLPGAGLAALPAAAISGATAGAATGAVAGATTSALGGGLGGLAGQVAGGSSNQDSATLPGLLLKILTYNAELAQLLKRIGNRHWDLMTSLDSPRGFGSDSDDISLPFRDAFVGQY